MVVQDAVADGILTGQQPSSPVQYLPAAQDPFPEQQTEPIGMQPVPQGVNPGSHAPAAALASTLSPGTAFTDTPGKRDTRSWSTLIASKGADLSWIWETGLWARLMADRCATGVALSEP
jgi:hypothetical protein